MLNFSKFQKNYKFYKNENGKVLYMVLSTDTESATEYISFFEGIDLIVSENLGFYSCLDEDEDLELRNFLYQKRGI